MATVDQIPSDLAIEIGEDLSPADFMAAARHFFGYVDEVVRQRAPEGEPIKWTVKVHEGSAVLAAVAPLDAPEPVLDAVYADIGNAVDRLEGGDVDGAGVSEAALKHLRGLSGLAEGRRGRPVPMRFWIRKQPRVIAPEIARVISEDWRTAYNDFGTVEGKLEAIQDRQGLQISIKDPLLKQAVRCNLPDSLLEQAFQSFRKRVEVSGLIHYRRNGVPTSISASQIYELPDDATLPTHDDVRGILAAH